MKNNVQPHFRTAIRERLKELLLGVVDVGDKIYLSRPNAVWFNEVPCCLIYNEGEENDTKDREPRKYDRTMSVNIHFLCAFDHELDADKWLDARAFEVESVLANHRELDLIFVQDTTLVRTLPSSVTGDGEQDVETLRLVIEVLYLDDLDQFFDTEFGEFKKMGLDTRVDDTTFHNDIQIRS